MTRILIVDDDVEQARALARGLAHRRPDLVVLRARNGVEAKKLMTERSIDLVLTDLRMPEMDGFELLAWVHNSSPGLPVFTMSGYGSPETAEQVNALGAIEHFPKPVDVKAVLARVTDAVSQSVRGHVHNVSLASFLQLLEMERKTCSLAVACEERSGVLVIRKGELTNAHTDGLHGEDAAIAIIAWPNPSIAIAVPKEAGARIIEKSLGFILMEAMRVQDEMARNAPVPEVGKSEWPTACKTWRPSSLAPGELAPPATEIGLPSGARAIAVVDTATGVVLRSASRADCPLADMARMAAHVLRQEAATLSLCAQAEGVEELVVSTTTHCDLIRPLGATEFALLVFAPEETNLAMARHELDRFLFTR
ncbi:MAG: response regulator [Polyangiaceae bacterium]